MRMMTAPPHFTVSDDSTEGDARRRAGQASERIVTVVGSDEAKAERLRQATNPKEKEAIHSVTAGGTSSGTGILARYCPHLSKAACRAARGSEDACSNLHFRPIYQPWSLRDAGDCTFLEQCRFRFTSCKYRHYVLDVEENDPLASSLTSPNPPPFVYSQAAAAAVPAPLRCIEDSQWIQCDLRTFDLSLLGKFGVVMVDPPW